jgi:hypothetical protein
MAYEYEIEHVTNDGGILRHQVTNILLGAYIEQEEFIKTHLFKQGE